MHQQAKSVAKRYPEVVPGLASLEAFAHASQYITSIVSVHDPLISDQLAFGKAVDLNARKSRAKNVPIIAVVAGEAGNAVRIARINLAQYCWKPDEDLRLAVPEIFPGEDAWWAGDGGPVQQIRFAEDAGEGSTWMVLRLLQSTVILRPQYHRSPIQAYVPEGGSKSHRVSTSRLDANPVLSLPIEKTGGVTHADIDINPWYHHQIAIVDQHGAWSLWVIERQDPKRGTYNINVWKAGHMYDDDESEEPHQNDGDGWGAICFAGNPSTLVICNRRNMAVFDVSGKPVRLGAPDIGLSRPSNWILDLRRSSLNRNHLFILTSSQIIWLHVSGAGEDSSIDTVHTGATVLMSWNHFRNDDDIGLRLQVQEHNAGTVYSYTMLRLT